VLRNQCAVVAGNARNGTDKLDTYMLLAGRDKIIKEILPEQIVRLIFYCSFPTHS
jgi:hypothetical protein